MIQKKAASKQRSNRKTISASTVERRLSTPNPNLVVIKIGPRSETSEGPPPEGAASVIAKLANVIRRPGTSRSQVFRSGSGRRVYAYSAYTVDPSMLVREDAAGRKTIGRFVNGRFRPVSAAPKV